MPNQPSTPQTPMQQAKSPITPALVREVTEKVYALFKRDLQIERERARRNINQGRQWRGVQ